ncbi:hypothetical protein [Clostridium weizhouense]|uniref:Uncharacterized protein n=1 Tax=Clostridium weizhouense TaxID=2859781 RepID=A0ABS7APG1_9CLOT|nr:hypothetical protein [Clostridium weizhouense]MBW6409993.1 hypothetical protein [Clostridium weizhouense]
MKKLRIIISFTIIALLIQHTIFLYIETIYLSSDMKIKIEKSDDKQSIKNEKKEIKLKEELNDFKVSSNGRFIASLKNGKINILDSNDNKDKELKSSLNGEVVFYKWVTNSDSIILIQKIKEKGKYYFKPIAFNAKTGDETELSDFNINKLKVKVENSGDKVEDIPFSIGTHSLYIKIRKSNGKCDLYYANIMNELEKKRDNKDIGNIVVPTTGANAIMEMGSNVTILDSRGNLSIPNFNNPKVLGTDIDDNVYFGSENNGKVDKICYSVASDKYKEWKQLKLDKAVDKEDILVDYSGKVYINDKDNGCVIDLISNKSIKYKGDLVQSYSKGIISKVGNKLMKNNI